MARNSKASRPFANPLSNTEDVEVNAVKYNEYQADVIPGGACVPHDL
jgi:hypothetical protein